jgi:integrase
MQRLPGDGWVEAEQLYEEQKADLHAGRTPRGKAKDGELTVKLLGDTFLTAKKRQLIAGGIGQRMFDEYQAIAQLVADEFGKDRLVDDLVANDFEQLRATMAGRWGPTRLGNSVQRVRTIFKYGYEAGLIAKPMRYGPLFVKPTAAEMRKNRNSQGERMLEAAECRSLLAVAPVQLKAMILLGLNCGFGNHDCATLPLDALKLAKGWIDYPRPKTGIKRRCPLWPETIAALKEAIAARPVAKSDAEALVFVLPSGLPWLCGGIANPVSVATRALMKTVGVHRTGLGHYTLRHVFRTVADGVRDQVAVDHIMGHADASMGATYRERIDDERLQAVVQHVHDWLFGVEGGAK